MNAQEMRDIVNTETEKRYDKMFDAHVANIEEAIQELAKTERAVYNVTISFKDQTFYKTRIIPYFIERGFEAKVVAAWGENDRLVISW